MRCPFCSANEDRVVDSRESRDGATIRRRRECLSCARRFTSYEQIEAIPYLVIKADGRREEFSRSKLLAGLLKACEKRPIPARKQEEMVELVEQHLHQREDREISTPRDRRGGDGRAAPARSGGLRAFRLGLPPFRGHRLVRRGDPEPAAGAPRRRRAGGMKISSPPLPEPGPDLKIPDVLPVLALKETVVFPWVIVPLSVEPEKGVPAVDQAPGRRPADLPGRPARPRPAGALAGRRAGGRLGRHHHPHAQAARRPHSHPGAGRGAGRLLGFAQTEPFLRGRIERIDAVEPAARRRRPDRRAPAAGRRP